MENMGGMMEGLGGIDPAQAVGDGERHETDHDLCHGFVQVASMQKMMGGKMKGRRWASGLVR